MARKKTGVMTGLAGKGIGRGLIALLAGAALTCCVPVALAAAGSGSGGSSTDKGTSAAATGTAGKGADEVMSADNGGVAWTEDADCASCHVSQAESAAKSLLLKAHPQLECVSCHDDAEKLEGLHAKATAKKAARLRVLRKTEVSTEMCKACHDTDELAEETEDFEGVVDDEGTVVNPHDLPTTAREHAYIDCLKCHSAHSSDEYADQANEYCMGCHHDGVYECYTCHA